MLEKNDFIEIEFTGKTKNGIIFDSNIKEDIDKAELKVEAKLFSFCLGQGMFLQGIDDFLIGKKIGKYEVELKPEQAFGKRDSKLIQMIPLKIFAKQQTQPVPGAIFQFDGRIAKILSVSGGRVLVDFNNPLAGKEVIYKIKILRKIEDLEEKINSLTDFLFKKKFDFEIKNKKIILRVDKQMKQFVEMFKDKYKEIFNLDLDVQEIEETTKEKSNDKKEIKEKKFK
jgi:FKBP-type peptidyl-prolyl cis-trans isomerase 2